MYNLPDDFSWNRFDRYMQEGMQADQDLYDKVNRLELQIEQVEDLIDTADDIGHAAITDFIHAQLEEMHGELNELREEIDAIEEEENWEY